MYNILMLMRSGLSYSEILGMTLVRFDDICRKLIQMNDPTEESADSQIKRIMKDPAIRKT